MSNVTDNWNKIRPENLIISIWQERSTGNYGSRPGDLEND